MKDSLAALYITIGAAILVVVFVAIVGFGLLGLQLPWENMQTKIIHQTNQYSTSAVVDMQNGLSDYRKLQSEIDSGSYSATQVNDMHCQQAADITRMQQDQGRIDSSLVPTDVQQFLATHDAAPTGCQ